MMLEKTLSELHGYRGWMIGKCRFSFGGEEKPAEAPGPLQQSCHLDVLRSDRRLAEVEITNPLTGDQLRVMLVRAVPGFLMVNRILEGYGDCIEASVRFYLPLRCQEPAELVEKKTGEQSRTVELFTDRGRILQMKLQGKDEGGKQL